MLVVSNRSGSSRSLSRSGGTTTVGVENTAVDTAIFIAATTNASTPLDQGGAERAENEMMEVRLKLKQNVSRVRLLGIELVHQMIGKGIDGSATGGHADYEATVLILCTTLSVFVLFLRVEKTYR